MAAADLNRCREVCIIRKTKELCLIFTLLTLLCPASSRRDKKELNELKERYQKASEHFQRLKTEHMSTQFTSSGKVMQFKKTLDMAAPLVSQYEETFPDAPPLNPVLAVARDVMEKAKAFLAKKEQEFSVRIEGYEKTMREIEMLISFLEQQHSEH